MLIRDLFVASVAFGLGLSMLQVALVNRGWCFESFFVRQLEEKRGRHAARKAIGLAGSAMILIGAWTAFSPMLEKSNQNHSHDRVTNGQAPH